MGIGLALGIGIGLGLALRHATLTAPRSARRGRKRSSVQFVVSK